MSKSQMSSGSLLWKCDKRTKVVFFVCMRVLLLESLWLKIIRTGCLELEVASQWLKQNKSCVLKRKFSASREDDFKCVLKRV